MFSDKDLPLGHDTIEYAWLVEVQLGHLKGKMTPSQVWHINIYYCGNSTTLDPFGQMLSQRNDCQ